MGMLLFIAVVYGGVAALGLWSDLAQGLRWCALYCLTLPLLLAWEGYSRPAVFVSLLLPLGLYVVAYRRDEAAARVALEARREAARAEAFRNGS